MRLKGTTSSPGFERLASRAKRVAASKPSLAKNGVPSRHETSRLHGHDNPSMEYGSTEMVMFGAVSNGNSDSANITRIAVLPDGL
ncbi:unnamed protein product [Heligmosomoides polygyrus]|uniref:Uncharacterized protein n=1 Tax=Heligmosomoides polygyrus TaxID=6339 RepID=A0A183GWV0_HELPZ|nr:unnamed protein product [Heligmosomoides polygyrus]